MAPDDQSDQSDQRDDSDPQNPDEAIGCTMENDVLPMAEIAATFGSRLDAARGPGGTLYFLTEGDGVAANATIGRRQPCKSVEPDWMQVTAPIHSLEVSSDGILYMAGFEDAPRDDTSARLLALDLTDPNALPFSLVSSPGEQIRGLHADGHGYVYWVQGWDKNVLWKANAAGMHSVTTIPFSTVGRVQAVIPTGTGFVWVSLKSGEPYIGTVTVSAGSSTVDAKPATEKFRNIVADKSGGYYVESMTSDGSPAQWNLLHLADITATPAFVDGIGGPAFGRYVFGATDTSATVLRLTSGGSTEASATVVSLPTPSVQ